MQLSKQQTISIITVALVAMLLWHLAGSVHIGSMRVFGFWIFRFLVVVLLLIGLRALYWHWRARYTAKVLSEKQLNRYNALKQQVTEVLSQISGKHWYNPLLLYRKPWYLVMGDKGSGKSAWLEQSGLHFTWRSVSKVKSDTSNDCDWYVSDEAVFLDIDHDFSLANQNGTNNVWEAFLRLLNRVRWLRPVNGVVMTIDVRALLNASQNSLSVLIQNYRERIESVQKHSFSRIPIYVFLTHADQMEGFDVFFQSINQQLREAPWGVTFPEKIASPHKTALDVYDQEYDALVQQLSLHVLPNMPKEMNSDKNLGTYHFPRKLLEIKSALYQVLEKAFYQSSVANRIQLRGFYLSACPPHKTGLAKKKSSGFFITEALHKVILFESSLGSIWQEFVNWVNTARKRSVGGAIVIVALLILLWISGFSRAQQYLGDIERLMAQYEVYLNDWNQAPNSPNATLDAMQTLRTASLVPATHYQHWWKYLGFGFPNAVQHQVNALYHQRLQTLFEPFVANEIENGLSGLLQNPVSSASNYQKLQYEQSIYNWLSSYLMLKETQHFNAQHVSNLLNTYWNQVYAQSPNTAQKFQAFERDWLQVGVVPLSINMQLVQQARQALGNQPIPERAYFVLETDAAHAHEPALWIGGRNAIEVFEAATPRLAYFFTQVGWNHWVLQKQTQEIQKASQQTWVLGKQKQVMLTDALLVQYRQRLQQYYWQDYWHHWATVVQGVQLIKANGLSQAAAQLKLLGGDNSPLMTLLNQMNNNLAVIPNDIKPNLNNAAQLSQWQNYVGNGDAMSNLQSALSGLARRLDAINNAANPGEAAFQWLTQMQQNQVESLSTLQHQITIAPEPIKSWLEQIKQNVITATSLTAVNYIESNWNNQVAPVCNRLLGQYYPVSKTANHDLPLANLQNFYAPNGPAQSFDQQFIEPLVTNQGGQLSVKQIFGESVPVPQWLINNVEAAQAVQSGFFKDNTGSPHLQMNYQPLYLSKNLASFSVSYDGKQLLYENGPRFKGQLAWPARHDNVVVMRFTTLDGRVITQRFYGTWALMKLFSMATISPLQNGQDQVTFAVGPYQATYGFSLANGGDFASVIALNNVRCGGS